MRTAREVEEGRQRLQQVEKLSTMNSLLAGAAHEINYALSIVIAQSALITATAPDHAMRARGKRIQADAEHCGRIVRSFLAMARQKPPERTALDRNALVRRGLEMVGCGLRSAGVEVTAELDETLPRIVADHNLVTEVVADLVIARSRRGSISPAPRRLLVTTRGGSGHVALSVEDNGGGVPDEIVARIFFPYFAIRRPVAGHGGVGVQGRFDPAPKRSPGSPPARRRTHRRSR